MADYHFGKKPVLKTPGQKEIIIIIENLAKKCY